MTISFVDNVWVFEQLPYIFEITDESRTDILNYIGFDVIQYMQLVLGKKDQYIDPKYLEFLKQDMPKIDCKLANNELIHYYLIPMIDGTQIKFNICCRADNELPNTNQ